MSIDPRWGDQDRDRKAAAILRTLRKVCGGDVVRGRWLDVGCGSGGIARALADHVDEVDGIDPERWGRWADYQNDRANLRFSVGECDGSAIPLSHRAYDVVVCNQVYEHVRDPSRLIANIHGVLADTGVCYFAGPNLLWPIEPHVHWPFVHWLPRSFALRLMDAMGSQRMSDLDAYAATSWRLQAWFEMHGFDAHNAIPEHLDSLPPGAALAPVARVLGRLPRALHDTLLPLSPAFVFVLNKAPR